jgi:hypothetical protein
VVVTSATATTRASNAASTVTGEAAMTNPAMVNETAAGKAAVSRSAIAIPIAAHIGGAHIRRAIRGRISAVRGIVVIAGRAIVITIIGGTDWHADADTNMDRGCFRWGRRREGCAAGHRRTDCKFRHPFHVQTPLVGAFNIFNVPCFISNIGCPPEPLL